jgi:hypothetical protein
MRNNGWKEDIGRNLWKKAVHADKVKQVRGQCLMEMGIKKEG